MQGNFQKFEKHLKKNKIAFKGVLAQPGLQIKTLLWGERKSQPNEGTS